MTPPPVDVAVIGGGPAGATAARLLSEWGHTVVLLHRPPEGRPPLAVSIPPSTRKILAAVGALAWVEGRGFPRTTGNTSWWGTDARVERFSAEEGDAGFQVLRSDLEALLLQHAAASGVAVRDDLRVREVRLRDPEGACLCVVGPGGRPEEIRASLVLDASGRAGVVARRGLRRADGPRTLALAAVWRRDGGFPVEDDSHTLVEAYADGWAWSVPVARGLRHVTVMVDPPTPVQGRRDLSGLYARELRKAGHLEAVVAGSHPLAPPWAADASTYGAHEFGGPHFLLVGDAGSFIDPLSSYGVKKALASAWLAAVAAHTSLRYPERGDVARGFYSRREQEVHARYAHETSRYAEQAARLYPRSAFWQARAAPPPAAVDDRDGDLAPKEEVQRAFQALKSRPRLDLALHPGVRIAPAPLVVGREIAMADALHLGRGSPVHFIGGLSAALLARLAPRAREVGDLFVAYNRAAPRAVELGEFLLGLATLIASGLARLEVPQA